MLLLHLTYCIDSINGVPACANKKLLNDILRKEWNFQGYVVSDDDAVMFAVTGHGYFPSNVEAAAGSINSGCNLELADVSKNWAFSSIPQVCVLAFMNNWHT